MTEGDAAATRAPRAAFRHASFRRWQGARLASIVGNQMLSVAIGWHVYDLTKSPLQLGNVGAATFVPAFAFSLAAGHAADRLDRKRIVLAYYVVMAACAAALFLLARAHVQTVWPIFVIAFCMGTARTFAGPAGSSLLPGLVPLEDFGNAVAWNSVTWQVATILGPALGGAVYAIAGSATAVFAASVMLSLVALAFAAGIHPRPATRAPPATLAGLFAGVRYVFQHREILGSITLDLFAVLLGGATALLPIYASDVLHIGALGLGVLRSAPAIGAGLTAIALAHRPIVRRSGAWMFGGVAVFGVATIVFALSRSFVLSLLALTVLGASDMVSVVVRQMLLQLRTPDEMRGRVAAVNLVFVGASNELGEWESGLTAAWLGVVPAAAIGGIGTIAVVGACALLFPGLRKLDRVQPPT
jgi:MFS family permease